MPGSMPSSRTADGMGLMFPIKFDDYDSYKCMHCNLVTKGMRPVVDPGIPVSA
jgi:hypothetical protein